MTSRCAPPTAFLACAKASTRSSNPVSGDNRPIGTSVGRACTAPTSPAGNGGGGTLHKITQPRLQVRYAVLNEPAPARGKGAQCRQGQHRTGHDNHLVDVPQCHAIQQLMEPQCAESFGGNPAVQGRQHRSAAAAWHRSQQDVGLVAVRVHHVGLGVADHGQQPPHHRRRRPRCDADRHDRETEACCQGFELRLRYSRIAHADHDRYVTAKLLLAREIQ
jgi:hypothetical protein